MFKEIFVKIKTEKDYDVCGLDIDYKIIVDKKNSKVILPYNHQHYENYDYSEYEN